MLTSHFVSKNNWSVIRAYVAYSGYVVRYGVAFNAIIDVHFFQILPLGTFFSKMAQHRTMGFDLSGHQLNLIKSY